MLAWPETVWFSDESPQSLAHAPAKERKTMNPISVSPAHVLLQYLLALDMVGPSLEASPTLAAIRKLPNAGPSYPAQDLIGVDRR
jgi:hypothetical protein